MFKNLKELRSVIFEEEPANAAPAPVSQPSPILGRDIAQIAMDAHQNMIGASDVEQVYNGLIRITDAGSCQSYAIVQGIQNDLKDAIADTALRMKAALTMAAKQGATRDKVMQEITAMKARLDQERDTVDKKLRTELSESVDGGTQEVVAREKEIQQKQQELENLRASIIHSKEKITRKRNAFETAYKRRYEELGQLQTEFSQYK